MKIPAVVLLLLVCSSPLISETVYPDRLYLLNLLESENFSELESLINQAQLSYESGEGSETQIAFILDTLANSNPEYEALFDKWVRKSTESYIPYLVRAYYYYDVAWSWRGHRRTQQTSGERIERMSESLKRAASELTQAILLKPRLSAADSLAIRILMLLNNDEYKERTLKEALEIDHNSYLVRASYLWSLKPEWGGDPTKLIKFARQTSDLSHKQPGLRNLKGYSDYIFAESLLEQRRYREAILHFDFAVEKGADHFIYRDRGINYYYLNQLDKALADFDESLRLWPQNHQVLRWRAQTLSKIGRNEEALGDLEIARLVSPMDRHVLMSQSYLLRKLKKYEQVISNYDNALFLTRVMPTYGLHVVCTILMSWLILKQRRQISPEQQNWNRNGLTTGTNMLQCYTTIWIAKLLHR